MYTITWIKGKDLRSISTPNEETAHSLWADLYSVMGYQARLWYKDKGSLQMIR